MGWHFRRGLNFGPFRLNLSRGGVGWSVGRRGARLGVNARGNRTVHTSIPGTGVGYRKTLRRGAHGCLVVIAATALLGLGGALLGAACIALMA
jgi:hypothetical protein